MFGFSGSTGASGPEGAAGRTGKYKWKSNAAVRKTLYVAHINWTDLLHYCNHFECSGHFTTTYHIYLLYFDQNILLWNSVSNVDVLKGQYLF